MLKGSIKNYVFITLGSLLTGLSLNLFLSPNHIAPGGVSAIASMISDFTPLSTGTVIALVNIPLFIASFGIDKSFFLKSLIGTALFAIFADITTIIPPLTDDLIISSVFGGAMAGVGLGLVLSAGGSTGGSDIGALLINKYVPRLKLGQVMMIIDIIIISIQGAVYGDITLCLYAVLGLYLSSKLIDGIIEGGGYAKAVYIISSKSTEIAEKISTDLDRGVTGIYGKGMYSGKDRLVILCIIQRSELPRIKKIIHEIDPDAFVILTEAIEVLGQGFKIGIN